MIAKQRTQSANQPVNFQAGYSWHSLPGRTSYGTFNVWRGFVSDARSGFHNCEIRVTLSNSCDFRLTWQSNAHTTDFEQAGQWYAFRCETSLSMDGISEKASLIRKVVCAIERNAKFDAQPEKVLEVLGTMGFCEIVRDDRIGQDVLASEVLPEGYTGWATYSYADKALFWCQALAVSEDGARAAILLEIAGGESFNGMSSEYQGKAKAWQESGAPVVHYRHYGESSMPMTFGQLLAAHRARYDLPTWEDEQKAKADVLAV